MAIALSALLAVSLAAQSGDAWAAGASSKHRKHSRHTTHLVYVRPQPASYIVDYTTGKVLESENPDSLRYPASLTKMMTLYLTFDALKKGKMRLDQQIPVSVHAASQPQTNIALKPGDSIAVKDAILSIVVRSANDSAVTLGEALGGSESGFAHKMTEKAHALGMKNTVFYNASGLPNPAQHTTARDMAILGRSLHRDFPQYFPFFKTESFSYHGQMYVTHNHVMTRYEGVDGIKTGYIRASGFNVVTSVNRGGHTLIAVVMGGPTWKARDDKMIALLDHTFTQLAALDSGNKTKIAALQKSKKVVGFPDTAYTDANQVQGEGDQQEDLVKPNNVTEEVPTAEPQELVVARPAAVPASAAVTQNLAKLTPKYKASPAASPAQ